MNARKVQRLVSKARAASTAPYRLARPRFALAAVLALWAAPTSVFATPKKPAPTASAPTFRQSEPIVLVLGNVPWNVDAESLTAALSHELNAVVLRTLPADASGIYGTLYLHAENNQLTARFESRDGNVTQRTVPVPERRDRAQDTMVILAGNVARDEAAELRAELRRRSHSPKEGAASTTTQSANAESDSDADPESDSETDSDAESELDGDPTSTGRPPTHSDSDPKSPRAKPPNRSPSSAPPKSPSRRPSPPPPGAPRPSLPDEVGTTPPSPCAVAPSAPHYWAGADFVPMVGTSLAASDAILGASLNVVGGLAGGVRGAQVGSVFNIVRGPVCGFQVGGVVNVTHDVTGLQVGGAVNVTGDVRALQVGGAVNVTRDVKGLQVGGALNITRDMKGLQVGGALNITRDMTGLQVGGAVNVTRHAIGLQIAGAANIAGNTSGLQVGGAANFAHHVNGAQVAGGINVASRARGFQLAPITFARSVAGAQIGVVNIAGRVKGVQIGVINIADDSDASLGVVNIVRKGRYNLDAWGAETGLLMAAFKHGGRYFHNFYGVGIRPSDGDTRLAFSLGIGGHIPLSERFFVDVDVLGYTLHKTDDFSASITFLSQARTMLGFRLTDGFAIVAGPSYNVSFATTAKEAALSLWGTSSLYASSGLFVDGWPGASVGVQAF